MDFLEKNKEKLPDIDQFKDAKNDFLKSIYSQASSRILSDNQVSTAQRVWEKLKNPPVWVNFSSEQVGVFNIIFDLLLQIQGRYASEFIYSMKKQLNEKGKLTDKQYKAVLVKMDKFKRALMKRIWSGRISL